RRDDLTVHPRCGDLALQRVSARPGFVTHPHGTGRVALERSHQPAHGVRLVRHLPRHRCRLVTDQHRDKEVLLVRVHPNERGNVFHDRLLSSAALTPRGANPRSRWHRPPCRVRQHYDLTIASRSFHIVSRTSRTHRTSRTLRTARTLRTSTIRPRPAGAGELHSPAEAAR